MKALALGLVAILVACNTDARLPIDAATDAASDALVDALPDAGVDAMPDASTLPEAFPNDGAHCLTTADCSGGVPCDQGVCWRGCFLGLCTVTGEQCYQSHCVWECSMAYQCPTTTSCTSTPSYALCI